MNSLLLCIPFAGLLLCIAVMPLVKPEWWEKHQALAVIVWSLLFIIPSIVLNGAGETTETVLECIVNDYLTFIVLLFGLLWDGFNWSASAIRFLQPGLLQVHY